MRKREHGSITIMTITTILFMIAFLVSTFMIIENRRQSQEQIQRETKEIYENDVKNANEIYDEMYEKAQEVCNHEWGRIETDETTGEQFVTCEICGKRENINNLPEFSGIKKIVVLYLGKSYILKNNGELYEYNFTGSFGDYIKYIPSDSSFIIDGIKDYQGGNYILLNNNKLYSIDATNLIASDVMRYVEYGNKIFYLTLDNDLYIYSSYLGTSTKISSNVQEFETYEDYICGYMVSNDLYLYHTSTNTSTLINNNVKNFKIYTNDYIFSQQTNNALYVYNTIYNESALIANNVKEYEGFQYLTEANDFYYYDLSNANSIYITNNISSFTKYGYYTKSNELLYYNTTENNSIHLEYNARIVYNIGYSDDACEYITTENDMYYFDRNTNIKSLKGNNIDKVGDDLRWYRDDFGEYYLLYDNAMS